MSDLTHALTEEIGDPDLFVGRKAEMARLLDWAEGVKRRISKSTGILSRRKMGKTALLQRFFNILYTRNDPQLIPFYYRIPEEPLRKSVFASFFYRRLLSQYFAFTTRTPKMVEKTLSFAALRELARDDPYVADDVRAMETTLERTPDLAWGHARELGHRISQLNDVRIIQLVDDVQRLDRWIVSDGDSGTCESLFPSYMSVAESKFSPQIVTGSYLGWLEAIRGKTVGRYTERHLGGFTDEEALEAVHAYATAYQVPVTDATARYIAEVCNNDPFYIAALISNQPAEKDLTTAAGVRDALAFETITDKGEIALVWRTHFAEACTRVDNVNARRIVLYLAGHEPAERDRAQIREDLDLTMTELKLEQCLHSLVMAGILAYGSSHFHFRGLGDKIFAMVLRSLCGEEIEQMKTKGFMANLSRQLIAAAAADSRHKDQATAKKKNLPAILRANPGATLHFDEESGCWNLIEFPKEPPPDNPDEDVAWLMRYVLASDSDTFENPEHGRYPEGILRAALECLDIRFEPDKGKWLTAPTREKLLNEN